MFKLMSAAGLVYGEHTLFGVDVQRDVEEDVCLEQDHSLAQKV